MDSQNQNQAGEATYRERAKQAILYAWSNHSKQLHEASFSGRLYSPYAVGTASISQGGTTLTMTGGTWDNVNWQTPAVIGIGTGNSPYLVTSFDSSSTLTISQPFIPATVSAVPYSIIFPTVLLPADFQSLLTGPNISRIYGVSTPISYGIWMTYATNRNWAGIPSMFALSGGDGINVPKLHLWPAPQTDEPIFGTYIRKQPFGYMYTKGAATLSAASTSVSGTGTYWAKSGFSFGSSFAALEVPNTQGFEDIVAPVASVGSDTTLTLASNWAGPAAAAAAYTISEILPFPETMRPALYATMNRIAAESRGDANMAGYYGTIELRSYAAADAAASRQDGVIPFAGFADGDLSALPWTQPRVVVQHY